MGVIRTIDFPTCISGRHMFHHYRRICKKQKVKYLKTSEEFNDLLTDFHDAVVHECLYNRFEYKAFERLGIFRIAKKKHVFVIDEPSNKINRKYVMIDWAETYKLWKNKPELKGKRYIYFTNKDTGGYYFKWEWSSKIAKFMNQNFYIFRPVKQGKKKLNKAITTITNYDAYEGVRKFT